MCGIGGCSDVDMPIRDFEMVMQSALLKEIIAVGINGGEPFLKHDLVDYVDRILTLPKLKSLFIISNGILTEKITEKLSVIYSKCKEKNIRFTVTFSIDGYRGVHDKIRGVQGAFDKTIKTIKTVQENEGKYCDQIGIICTISKHNIYYVNELLAYAALNNLPQITYQLAVNHQRLHNDHIFEDFSVMTDEHMRLLAQEFFFRLYADSGQGFYYYSIYRYIESKGTERLVNCNWAYRDVTIDASGSLYYCATKSKAIGSIYDEKPLESSFFDKQNMKYRKELVETECGKCVHYSGNEPYFAAYAKYVGTLKKSWVWRLDYIHKGRRF